jgi:hypothetical protein
MELAEGLTTPHGKNSAFYEMLHKAAVLDTGLEQVAGSCEDDNGA